MALVGVLLLLMMMTALSAALAVSGQTETLVARNYQTAAQARAAAEAGLNHAVAVTIANLQDWQTNGFASGSAAMSRLLRGPDDATGGTADADNGSLASLGIPLTGLTLTGLPGVTYEARLFDDDDDAGRGVTLSAADIIKIGEDGSAVSDANTKIVVRATGRASGSAVATIEAMIAPPNLPAVLTNQNLTISGNAQITGTQGSMHSNANLTISGNPAISEDATASGTYSTSGNPEIGGLSGGGYANMRVPTVQASDHLSKADFILKSDGTMTNPGGTVICNASANNDACKDLGYAWVFQGANGWIINNQGPPATNIPLAGTYYVEGDARISGNPGSALTPATISIIAEGSIEISGNPTLRPDSPGLLFVTDGDLKISGNMEAEAEEAQMLVREQLMISGNPEIAGQILVEDAANVSTLVTSNTISGNPAISYNGTAGGTSFTQTGWRSVP